MIMNLLINDSEFITEKVDSDIYFRYVASIEEYQTQEIKIKAFDYEKNKYNYNKTESKSNEDDDDNNVKSHSICNVCQKVIENKTDIFNCCSYPYHIKCIKCRICHKKNSDLKDTKNEPNQNEYEEENEDRIICVAPCLFL